MFLAVFPLRIKKVAQEWRKRVDADGDGNVSPQERAAFGEKLRAEWKKHTEAADADGDGKVSREERRDYWKKLRDKYDADGDGKLNDQAIQDGSRILSAYLLPDETKLWIITDAAVDDQGNRQATTLLLPEEY